MTEVAKRFIWTTQHGEDIAVSDMKTSHLFHSVRMIYNNTCPPGWETRRRFNRYILNRPTSYWKEAVNALANELSSRTDLAPYQISELAQMATNLRLYFAKYLPK